MTRREMIDKSWREGWDHEPRSDRFQMLLGQGTTTQLDAPDTITDTLVFRMAWVLGNESIPINETTLRAAMAGAFLMKGDGSQAALMMLVHEELVDPHPDPVDVLSAISSQTVVMRDRATGEISDSWPSSEAQKALDWFEATFPQEPSDG